MNVFPVNHGISDFLSHQAANYQITDEDKSINSRRHGVLLMCALQILCGNEKLSIDLYLQTDCFNKTFMWFITIGFWHSARYYVPSIADQKKKNASHFVVMPRMSCLTVL